MGFGPRTSHIPAPTFLPFEPGLEAIKLEGLEKDLNCLVAQILTMSFFVAFVGVCMCV